MGKKFTGAILVIMMLSITVTGSLFGMPDAGPPERLTEIQKDSTAVVEAVWNPATGTASFIHLNVPTSTLGLDSAADFDAQAVIETLSKYRELFGIQNAEKELRIDNVQSDQLGFEHYHIQQLFEGVPVYGGEVLVHFDTEQAAVTAISSSFIPGVKVDRVTPDIGAGEAIAQAKLALPGGTPFEEAQLIIFHDFTTGESQLSWLINLDNEEATIVNRYFIDAHEGGFLQTQSLLVDARNRLTYDAENGTELPGLLRRAEDSSSFGDTDVDNAHDFAGETYDYYFNVHERDSFDDEGAALVSVAHYGENFRNAQWVSSEQLTRYGDGLAVRDVIAHEWTHGVIDQTANLEYRWQSGALNESFADIFGAMVDRDDWLIGEDLPASVTGGRPALRDLSDPSRFGHTDHADQWVQTCSDEEGVHTNSGITNKAFYNVATTLDKERAEKIFYRALTIYMSRKSSLEDARAAALQAATDIHGKDTTEYNAVEAGFNAVGIDGEWNPPGNDCGGCAVTSLLAIEEIFSDGTTALHTAATLYRLRDKELSDSIKGQHYQDLYANHTGRISVLMALQPDLRSQATNLLTTFTPSLDKWMDGDGSEEIVSADDVIGLQRFLLDTTEADRRNGGGDLGHDIEREMELIDWDQLVGMTYDEAADYLLLDRFYHVFIPSALWGDR